MLIKTNRKRKSVNKFGYRNMPIGGIIEKAGNSIEYVTGDWRVRHPYIDKNRCTNCLICYIYCPEKCICVKDNKIDKVDLLYCKGCGVCESECAIKAIKMISEMNDF